MDCLLGQSKEAVVERWPLEEVRLYSEIDRRRLVEKRAYS